ncbi:MAG: hypothetical protein OEY59_04180 [Deltaproteobacteria bacterium]|nr:hypothetical protein [Deltaproteobacteria bacterium]
MTYLKLGKPEFYKDTMKPDFFLNANKIVKYQESYNYWIYSTGKKVYKVKKKEAMSSAISLDKVFCTEIVDLISRHSPELEAEVQTLHKSKDSFGLFPLDSQVSKNPYYVIVMNQLSSRLFLDKLILKNMVSESMLEMLSRFLIQFHQATQAATSKNAPTADFLSAKLEDLFYQSRKYLSQTISQAVIDMTQHPLERYFHDAKKLIARRTKKGCVKKVHGCFVPRKINLQKDLVLCLGKSAEPLKNQYMDVASDIADLTVELSHFKLGNEAGIFTESYQKLSKDKELPLIMPIFLALRCLSQGLKHSMATEFTKGEEKQQHQKRAASYYEQLIPIVKKLPT